MTEMNRFTELVRLVVSNDEPMHTCLTGFARRAGGKPWVTLDEDVRYEIRNAFRVAIEMWVDVDLPKDWLGGALADCLLNSAVDEVEFNLLARYYVDQLASEGSKGRD